MTGDSTGNQDKKLETGSQQSSGPVFLAVGKLRRPHGLQGEINMEVLTDFPERLKSGSKLYIGEQRQEVRLVKIRRHSNTLLLSFENYSTPEQVGELRNQVVFVSTDNLPPLPEGEFYQHELVGLTVLDETGQPLGKIVDILETGSSDVLVVRQPSGGDVLIPYLDSLLMEVNLAKGTYQTRLIPGLLDE
jgi:16S rRNA processing protein RimM